MRPPIPLTTPFLTLWQGHTDIVSVAVSPDGQRVVSGSYDMTVRIWNMTDGALLHNLTVSPLLVTRTVLDGAYIRQSP